MKKLMIVIALLAAGTMAFAMGAREDMSEEEALARIDAKIAELGLTLEDAGAAKEAFLAIEAAGVRLREALSLTEESLKEGLRAGDMLQLAEQVRERIKTGDSAEQLKEMIRERIRTATRAGGNGNGQAPGGAEGAGAAAGAAAGPAAGAGPGVGLRP